MGGFDEGVVLSSITRFNHGSTPVDGEAEILGDFLALPAVCFLEA
jgi:hypothetical protein